ncbi:MAG TPA: TonB-dependent receptor [Candidatus Acidoferrales bacterium]|nr:TonB-dependent receptor [Candidatus Acidoferrales bacterium]
MLAACLYDCAYGQTTGRIVGVVWDPSGAVIPEARVTARNEATGEERKARSDSTGAYAMPLVPPGLYRVQVAAKGFRTALFESVRVTVTETATVDAHLTIGPAGQSVTVSGANPLVQSDGPQLGRVVDSRGVASLPLASGNFTQLLSLSPGTATFLPDSTASGRNTQAISVNGARVTQNNIQVNGVDANTMGTNGAILVAVPAPETIEEFKVQTALYDASYGRAGGADIQLLTKSGEDSLHGSVYEYFRNETLNANNPFLAGAGAPRPELKRNGFGGTLGGPVRKDRAFFFVSYQGTRETNGASIINSLSQSVPVAAGLTNDRSAQTLRATFHVPSVDPAALALLNARLPNGTFVIPTPQANGLYSGSSPSTFGENQFNTNFDYHSGSRNSLSVKFFFANTSQRLALPSFRGTGPNVPGFGTDQTFNNRVAAIQDIYAFSSTLFNEARIGYAFNSNATTPDEPVTDAQIGIARSNAASFPGLPLIRIAPAAGGVTIGTPTNISPTTRVYVTTLYDSLSVLRGRHTWRTGLEIRINGVNFDNTVFNRGQIDFQSFTSFLTGSPLVSTLGNGMGDRSQRARDYNVFFQDDWKISPRLTANLGLRYELDLPVYDTRGRLTTFDPTLYVPRQLVVNAVPAGPPVGGFVQEENIVPSFVLPGIPKVGKGLLRSIDPYNLAPRIGFAYSPPGSGRLAIRGGYGIFYSRATFQYASLVSTFPPAYVIAIRTGTPLSDPFFTVPPVAQFPTFVPGINLSGTAFDRNLQTPYVQQFGLSLQYELGGSRLLELAYVGTRGVNLFRQVAINEARLASPQVPIVNDVTGQAITTNSPNNAQLRAPFQGVSITGFSLNQTTAQSTYHSLQLSLTQRLSHGLEFLASYTYAKSIDNASGSGGGAGTAGLVNTGAVGDTSAILGDQRDPRANRGVSDFDRTHRFVLGYVWDLPEPEFASRPSRLRSALSHWQVAGVVTAMSGLPVDVVDTGGGSFYGLSNGANPLARPSFAPGENCASAEQHVPAGYFFNPFSFARPVVQANQAIPSSAGAATAAAVGTDIGDVARNCLRGPRQVNLDFSLAKRFLLHESTEAEFRAEFFNLLNHVNFASPISNFNAVVGTGGSISPTGQVVGPGNFGRIISTSNNPRVIQFALKFNF